MPSVDQSQPHAGCARRIALLVGTILQSARGAGWRQPVALNPGALPERQQVQVWVGREPHQWHAVRLTADSITGVPFVVSASCDSCRVSIARATVDSVRLGNPTHGFLTGLGLTVAAGLGLILILCGTTSPCQFNN